MATFTGTGRIEVDGQDLGEARYTIHTYKSGHMDDASGILRADSGVLWAAQHAKSGAELILEDGGRVTFIISHQHLETGRAQIEISGDVPLPE